MVGIQITCLQLHKKAEKIAQLLVSCPSSANVPAGGLSTGDHVALMFSPGPDLIAGFYGCLYAGCVPVPIRPLHPRAIAATTPTAKMIVDVRSISHSILAVNVLVQTTYCSCTCFRLARQ